MKYNRQSSTNILRAGSLFLAVTAVMMPITSQYASAAEHKATVTLDPGTVIPVRLDDPLSSSQAQKGDTFLTTIRVDRLGSLQIPAGSRVEGLVREAKPQKDKNPGVLDVSFRRLILPNGRSYAIEGSLIGLDGKSVDKKSDGRIVAKPAHRNDRLTYVGIGAGAGAVIGLFTKRTVEDAAIGGGLGYLFGALQKGDKRPSNVNLKSGTELGVRIDRRVTFSGSDSGSSASSSVDNSRYHKSLEGTGGGSRLTGANDIGVLVGDRNVTFSSNARPVNTANGVLVPIKPVLAALDIPFNFDTASQEMRLEGTQGTVRLAVNSSVATTDNKRVRLGSSAQRIHGVLYVPIKLFALLTGTEATYDRGSHTVLINGSDKTR